jgi:hypothetical protein
MVMVMATNPVLISFVCIYLSQKFLIVISFLLAVKIILLLRSRVENFKLLTLSFEVESSRGAFKLTWQDIELGFCGTLHVSSLLLMRHCTLAVVCFGYYGLNFKLPTGKKG